MSEKLTNNVYYIDVKIILKRGKEKITRSIKMPSKNNTLASVTSSEIDTEHIRRIVKNVTGGKIDGYTIQEVKVINILS